MTPLPPHPPLQRVVEPPPRELSDDEEAALRQRGRRREAFAVRDDVDVGRRIDEAVKKFRELAGRAPTPDEANEIRRRARGEEATGT